MMCFCAPVSIFTFHNLKANAKDGLQDSHGRSFTPRAVANHYLLFIFSKKPHFPKHQTPAVLQWRGFGVFKTYYLSSLVHFGIAQHPAQDFADV